MNNLENSFKEALTDFDEISPSEGLWTRISTSLLLKSAGFKAALFSLLALLLVGLPSYFILSNKGIDKTPVSSIYSENVHNSSSTPEFLAKTNTQKASSKSTISNNTNQKNISNNTNQKNISNNTIIKPKTKHEENKTESDAKDINKSTKSVATTIKVDKTIAVASASTNISNSSSKKTSQAKNQEAMVSSNTIIATPSLVATKSDNKNITNKKLNPVFVSDENYKSTESKESIELFATKNDLNRTKKVSFDNDQFRKPILVSHRLLYHNELEVFAGPNIAFNQIKTNDNSLQNTIDLRITNEKPKLSYHFGLNYKTYYKNWFVGIGINYHRIEDRASYQIPYFEIDSAVSSYMIFSTSYHKTIVGYIQNPNDPNSQVPIYQVTVQQDTSTVHKTYYDSTQSFNTTSFTNSYSFIEIPLSIGREINYKNFVIDISGGVAWNRLIKTQVSIPNEDGSLLISGDDLNKVLVKNTFNALFSLGVAYRMNEGSLLFIRPQLRYNMNSLFDKEYPISQKYLQIRMSLGMRIKL